tara:strand:+ start:885 stop:1643 length:759 start_codon:yes stop_codon:yes gene_type:complete
MDENWRNDLDNIKTAQNVLSDKDLKELRTYMYNNMAFHETQTHRRIARKDKKDFPIYNFLPKENKPKNLLEKYIVGLMAGQEHHIEYWVRYNDSMIWHIDSDEIIERTYGVKIYHTKEYPISSYVFHVDAENVEGGELQLAPFDKRDTKSLTIEENFEPKHGTKVITIPAKTNQVISWEGPIYHRVLPQYGKGRRLSLVWSLWKEIPWGFKRGLHWMPTTLVKQLHPNETATNSTAQDLLVSPVEWPIKEDL